MQLMLSRMTHQKTVITDDALRQSAVSLSLSLMTSHRMNCARLQQMELVLLIGTACPHKKGQQSGVERSGVAQLPAEIVGVGGGLGGA